MIRLADKIRQRQSGITSTEPDVVQSASVRNATIRDRLVLQELQELRTNLSSQCSIHHPDPNKLHEFTLIVRPNEGIWADGSYHFNIVVPEGYNHTPPLVHCATQIWHPNIDEAGRVCLSLLRQSSLDFSGWAPTRRLLDVVWGIESLFSDLCDFNDALNTTAAEQYLRDPEAFHDTARSYVFRFARLMQPMKLFNLLRRENVITLCTLRLASTTKSPTPRNLDNQTQKSIERVKDDKKSQAETVYKVPEYYEHKTFCFYDSEIQLKGFRLPQPNPS